MADNYQDVLDQLQAAGLGGKGVDDGLRIGSMTRTRVEGEREKRGWYSLHELTTESGKTLLVGSFGVWHGNDNCAQKIQLTKTELSADQRAALKARIREDRKHAAAIRKADAKRAADHAAKAWRACDATGESVYLTKKGVQGHGVRYSPSGALVIPVMDINLQVQGLQVVRDARLAEDTKRPAKEFWPKGMVKRGHFHMMGMPAGMILVAEGYATAASVHEATSGVATVVAFDAGNLQPVCTALHKRYPSARIVICADDDVFGDRNTGVESASSAALAVGGTWLIPIWADDDARKQLHAKRGIKRTDFNDLATDEGISQVTRQLQAHLGSIGWKAGHSAETTEQGGGDGALRPIASLDHLIDRFTLVYAHGGSVFDHKEHRLVPMSDMRDICVRRELHRQWAEHPDKSIVRPENVGFDPGSDDDNITCNLWAGWPTEPKAGKCDMLLDVLRHMCSADKDPERLFNWVIQWIAYPIQHPGAKMKTTVVVHGPQGTGKNAFFEAVMEIYGRYGRMIDQNALEDKFNDWASGKLFLLADEVIARSDLYHVKNKLKSFITGRWVRINPKNMAAYDERNHANIVFLSNESMPVVLEQDDRRHCVIWTPAKKDPDYYTAVFDEIRDGGVAALHDYLLNTDLDGFHTSSAPPETGARDELLSLSQDSTTRFYHELLGGDIGLQSFRPALVNDVYECYKLWCARSGNKAAPLPRLQNAWLRRHGIKTARKRYYMLASTKGPHAIFMMGMQSPDGGDEKAYLGECVEMFRKVLDDYRGAA